MGPNPFLFAFANTFELLYLKLSYYSYKKFYTLGNSN